MDLMRFKYRQYIPPFKIKSGNYVTVPLLLQSIWNPNIPNSIDIYIAQIKLRRPIFLNIINIFLEILLRNIWHRQYLCSLTVWPIEDLVYKNLEKVSLFDYIAVIYFEIKFNLICVYFKLFMSIYTLNRLKLLKLSLNLI